MSAPDSATVEETARRWVLRVHAAAFADWDGLTDWLERDPAHLTAYDAAVVDDAWVEAVLRMPPLPIAVETLARPRAGRRWAMVGGAAAAAAALALVGSWLAPAAAPQEIATGPGQRRSITLADGSTIVLNGNTRVAFAADRPRAVTLAAGEALFTIRHNPRDPFVVTVGGTRLVDAGTVFDVVRDGDALDVTVAQGVVVYAPDTDHIRLDAGARLTRASAMGQPRVGRASAESIGSWRSGRLSYDDAPLERVARDLSRNIGAPIRVSDQARDLRFSGTVTLADTAQRTLERAGPLLGVRFVRAKAGWAMTVTDAAP
ncbi:FecR family protein [Sphingomonas glacialis]|nr:FecR domain-containing protein [Sphingomonas glacialis]